MMLAGLGVAACLFAAMPGNRAGAVQSEATSPAQPIGANLNITPTRVTLDRGTRTGTVYIYNQGTESATFDISLVDRVMLESGDIKSVADIADTEEGRALAGRLQSARGLVMATPRRAVLAPGKGQTIRIRLMQPPEAGSAGEYRTHLTVSTIPPPDAGVTADQAARQPGELSFNIRALFGLSIPVIVRTGPVQASGSIENIQLAARPDNQGMSLSFDIVRTGANSLYGNIEVRSERDGDTPLGAVRGVGVYPEIGRRTVHIPLQRNPAPGERLTITFTDDDANAGNVTARALFTAP